MPADKGVRLDDRQRIANFREQPIETNEYHSVDGAEGEFLWSSSPQNVDLLPQRPNLCLKHYPRPDQIHNHPTNEPAKIPHCTRSSSDSRSTAKQDKVCDRDRRRITSEDPMTKSKSKSKVSTRSAGQTISKSKPRRSAHSSPETSARSDTKHARILAMLRSPAGATIAAIMTATEWQQHSVRGFLAGVVRKKLGLNLVSEQTDKGRVYRIKDSKASSGNADRVKQAA
jgi:hypothetical protein